MVQRLLKESGLESPMQGFPMHFIEELRQFAHVFVKMEPKEKEILYESIALLVIFGAVIVFASISRVYDISIDTISTKPTLTFAQAFNSLGLQTLIISFIIALIVFIVWRAVK